MVSEATDKKIGLLIVVILAVSFIFIGGSFLHTYNQAPTAERNPLYFAIGIAFAGAGGQSIAGMIQALLVPPHIRSQMNDIRTSKKLF